MRLVPPDEGETRRERKRGSRVGVNVLDQRDGIGIGKTELSLVGRIEG